MGVSFRMIYINALRYKDFVGRNKLGPMATSNNVQTGSIGAWMIAARPASLPIAIAPVLVGCAIAFARHGAIDARVAWMALTAALLMQVLTNLQNDVGFTARGAEAQGARTGLPRATAQGWLRVSQVRLAIVVLSVVATALGMALVALRGWPVLAIGVASLVAALAYMGGPKPIAYTPFGELTVLVFFGGVAVLGTEWLLADSISALGVMASIGVGSMAAAALAANNHRDREHDQSVGRRTFAVVWGAAVSEMLYGVLILSPFLILVPMAWVASDVSLLIPWLLAPLAMRLLRDFHHCSPGAAYNRMVFRTFRLVLTFAALLALSLATVRQ